MQIFPAAVACLLVSLIVILLLMRLQSRTAVRVRQLKIAVDLLSTHARMLDRLLFDPAVPDALKDVLVAYGDAIGDRPGVSSMMRGMAEHPSGRGIVSAQPMADVRALLDKLAHDQPELSQLFSVAVLSGMSGACLRWPENASHFEAMMASVAATPSTEATIAATVAAVRQSPGQTARNPMPMPA